MSAALVGHDELLRAAIEAHGGQVLLSEAARQGLGDKLPPA